MARSYVVLLLMTAAVSEPVTSQPPTPKATETIPCCAITAIDARTGIVTAQEASTGHVFRFEAKDRGLLGRLKIGQKVWADFAASQVRVDPVEPCCSILGGASVNSALHQPAPPAPCCGVTAIDPATGIVTARISASGQTFQFKVANPALLGTLKVGDKVWANGATRKVGLSALELCCAIVGPVPAGMP